MLNKHMGQIRMEQMSFENEYKDIYSILANRIEEYPVNIAPKMINEIILAVLQDHPEIFWFEGKWRYGINSNREKVFRPIYNMNEYGIEKAQEEICRLMNYFDELFKDANRLEIARGVYQWIVHNVKYGVSTGEGQNIYDALISQKAVCKGIAKTYQLLLARYNIFSALAVGSIYGVGKHVWNVIEIDKKFYNVDICMEYEQLSFLWGKKQRNSFKGFMLSDREISDNHKWEINYPYRIRCYCDGDDNGGI